MNLLKATLRSYKDRIYSFGGTSSLNDYIFSLRFVNKSVKLRLTSYCILTESNDQIKY